MQHCSEGGAVTPVAILLVHVQYKFLTLPYVCWSFSMVAHVLMLVKEYVYQDSNEDHSFENGIGKDDEMTPIMEKRVCEHIGNTRVMIHFFVFSLVVFYCNRVSPSTFDDTELKNFFEVARFSVILALKIHFICLVAIQTK
jgi:hypothetical protein